MFKSLSRAVLISAGLAASMMIAGAAAAQGRDLGVRVGLLKCDVEGGIGLIFGSTRDVECVFTSSDNQLVQHYDSAINRFGADIGYRQHGVMLWAVFAPSADVDSFALAGEYIGATAEASVGIGAGVNVLVGGFEESFALQPVAVQGVRGVNVTAGITELSLRGAREGLDGT